MANNINCTCGHSWSKSSSSKKDMNICHICGKDNTMKDGGWLNKYEQGGLVLKQKTKDNYGKKENANEGHSTAGPGWVGEGTTNRGFNYNGAWGGTMQNGGFLQPTSYKLPPAANEGAMSTEKATSIGGGPGEPAYLIPTFKYGKPLKDPEAEYRKTGEHLGGPFKTYQEAEKFGKMRHQYVEQGRNIPSPYKWWDEMQMGGSLPDVTVYGHKDPGTKGYFDSELLKYNNDLFINNNDFLNRLKASNYIKEQYNKGLDFHTKWLNSPMHNKMLNASDPENATSIAKERKQRLNSIKFNYNPNPNPDNNLTQGDADVSGNITIYPIGIGSNSLGTHEVSHVTDMERGKGTLNLIPLKDHISIMTKTFDKRNLAKHDASPKYNDYVAEPTETRARLNQIRQQASENKLYDPFNQKITPAIFNKLKSFKFEKNEGADPFKQLQSTFTDDQILELLNSVSKNQGQNLPQAEQGGSVPGAVGFTYARTAGSAPSNGKYAKKTLASAQNGKEMKFYQEGLDFTPKTISKNGSVIKDDMGQWAHPGEITEINSNNITMEGVDYPVLGVSDTGDTKMMQPGKNYKFMGKKVTEFPMAQSGKKLTAKQIKQNEEFLQNQKSFYDYLTQNDRQDYPIDYTNQYPALKSDATRNVIPRRMTDKEKLEAVAISDQAQKRALNNAKEVIAERKRNASQKGDLNTPGSWHTEDKGRLFPESVGGLGEMYDDYLNPLTIVGSLADSAGESIAARDPKSLALTLGMAGGLGALGFSPLNDAIALKGGVDNLFNKGVSSLASYLRRPGTPLNTYYDDLAPQLALPTTERMALPSTQRMGLPYTQQLGLPQPALQQAISRAAQNLGRVPYQEPTAAELAEMNLREATRYAPRVNRTGRQRMGNPDDMRALYNPPAQQATIPFGETQPVNYDDFDWAVRPDAAERFQERIRQQDAEWAQRSGQNQLYESLYGQQSIPEQGLRPLSHSDQMIDQMNAAVNVPTQRIPDYDNDADMVAAFMSRPQAQRIPDPSTYTNTSVNMTPEEIAMSNASATTDNDITADFMSRYQASLANMRNQMSNATSVTGAPATAAPTATAVNPQSSFTQKGYALNSEPIGSYQTVDPTSGNKIDYDINESERDGIKGTYGDYTMRDDNDGYFHFGLFKPNDPNEYARISPGMTFRNEGPGATKQLQMMMSRLPKKVEVPHISTSIYSTPLMDSHFSRISQNQPGRLTLDKIRLSPLNDWKREQDGKSYIDQIIDQFPKLQKWSKKLGENTGYQLPEPVINLGSNPVTIDELKAIQNNKGNYSPEDWYDLTERLHVLAPKYNVKKHWRNGGSSNWLDKYK